MCIRDRYVREVRIHKGNRQMQSSRDDSIEEFTDRLFPPKSESIDFNSSNLKNCSLDPKFDIELDNSERSDRGNEFLNTKQNEVETIEVLKKISELKYKAEEAQDEHEMQEAMKFFTTTAVNSIPR
eukprot:TRINITY_DN6302_c0_g1_i2.p3 TRINITY_DN6302_c0_g1~~TRINITY_DN6302_c0_g1_i2.p3  ORF type:complete len:126 (+),score=22.86 TRINITY_DN6302_c0_g1_i2:82-459(+)